MLGKDKLINLKLTVFLSYLEAGQFFRNVKVNRSKIIGIDRFWLIAKSLTIFLPSVVESQRRCQNSVIVHDPICKLIFQTQMAA